jgi:hypothetical protein
MKPPPSTNRTTAAPIRQFLESGDRLSQSEFHRRYLEYPKHVKAELIGGVVYMASPLRRPHGANHLELGALFLLYKAATPGLEALDNTTIILGAASEPQPDLALRIMPTWGGQSGTNTDEYVVGPPELLAEIAHSNCALALHNKRNDYESAGVREYLVVCLEEQEIHWFDFKNKRELRSDDRGVYRSTVFPGLWIDGPAVLAGNSRQAIKVLQRGLRDKSHAAFCKRLDRRRPPE